MTMNSVSTRPTVAATANRSSRETFFRSANARRYTLLFLQVAIVVLLLGGWELGVRSGNINAFLFSSPSAGMEVLVQRFQSVK
ncbi:hypothetical protein LZ023_36435 (plasmid) [Pseudomonas silvicola]|nr:hypothetical protein LZ023_36435 [Pseudomonas silvicola]